MKYYVAVLAICTACAANAQSGWKAGVAKVDVTPNESIWLSGYGNRSKAVGSSAPADFRQGGCVRGYIRCPEPGNGRQENLSRPGP